MRDALISSAIGFVVFVIYALTSAPGLGSVDSGELTTAAATLGIAHPSGYPLYVLLGRTWLALTPIDPDRAMVLFSVFCGSLSAALLLFGVTKLARRVSDLSNNTISIASAVLILAWALSAVPWQSIGFAEVYPLSALISATIVLCAIGSSLTDSIHTRAITLALGAFVWGLGFGNHLTIMWHLPLLIYLWYAATRHSSWSGPAALGLIMFVLGASVNLFLPLRSAMNPTLDWGNTETLSNLIRHVSGWQYRVWLFENGLSGVLAKFVSYVAQVPATWGLPITILFLVGAAISIIEKQWLVVAALSTWVVSALYNVNYEIPDIATYEVVSSPVVFLVTAFGLFSVIKFTRQWLNSAREQSAVVIIVSATALFVSVAANHASANQSRYRFIDSFVREVLRTVDRDAVIFQANWDIQSPTIYLQNIERYRTDVAMFDLNLLQRNWYFREQAKLHPELCRPCSTRFEEFLKAVRPFEQDEPFDPIKIETAYVGTVRCMIDNARAIGRPVYLRDPEEIGHPGVAEKYPFVGGAMFFRISDEPTMEPLLDFARIDTNGTARDPHVSFCLTEAAKSTLSHGYYALDHGDSIRAAECAALAARFAPGLPNLDKHMRVLTRVEAANP